ncbi:hypothetical protein V8C86DRAFT_2613473 [Haematococcus lacustris]
MVASGVRGGGQQGGAGGQQRPGAGQGVAQGQGQTQRTSQRARIEYIDPEGGSREGAPGGLTSASRLPPSSAAAARQGLDVGASRPTPQRGERGTGLQGAAAQPSRASGAVGSRSAAAWPDIAGESQGQQQQQQQDDLRQPRGSDPGAFQDYPGPPGFAAAGAGPAGSLARPDLGGEAEEPLGFIPPPTMLRGAQAVNMDHLLRTVFHPANSLDELVQVSAESLAYTVLGMQAMYDRSARVEHTGTGPPPLCMLQPRQIKRVRDKLERGHVFITLPDALSGRRTVSAIRKVAADALKAAHGDDVVELTEYGQEMVASGVIPLNMFRWQVNVVQQLDAYIALCARIPDLFSRTRQEQDVIFQTFQHFRAAGATDDGTAADQVSFVWRQALAAQEQAAAVAAAAPLGMLAAGGVAPGPAPGAAPQAGHGPAANAYQAAGPGYQPAAGTAAANASGSAFDPRRRVEAPQVYQAYPGPATAGQGGEITEVEHLLEQ